MKIKNISYYSVNREESSKCDCCGKAIKNICCVTTIEEEHFSFGTTCFNKIIKDRLQGFQQKEMKKILKSIKFYCDAKETWQDMTEEKYETEQYNGLPFAQWDKKIEETDTFEKYKDWIINELIPLRIEEEEKKLKKFKNIEF